MYSTPRKKKVIPKQIKSIVWDEYIGEKKGVSTCMCCNINTIKQMDFICGHIVPECNGGEISVKNLRPICSQCNLSMGSTNMIEYMKQTGQMRVGALSRRNSLPWLYRKVFSCCI